ncbi:hypothetical protein Pyn_20907 [Prunus yedoensis var. nudiflora]|uniref:Uncharacterized protein n=1 Tax=Prunus yedoensis var. nudiflora TaxID=2094558 RepID=A0A314YNS8_PRUYE|nr:hypothetical protein Pyn_20907 [Prunus yedoensis var. nudiflora]
MSRTMISDDQYQQALSSKASMLLHLRGIRNFVEPQFRMSAGRSRALIQQIRRTTTMWTVVTNFHGFIFLLC